MNEMTGSHWKKIRIVSSVLLLVGLLAVMYAPLIDYQVLGFLHDDGVYAIVANALAAGKGFTLPHVPASPAQIKYPIIYPLLLALGWLLNPVFPTNLPVLHWLTTGIGIAGIGVLAWYLRAVKACSVNISVLIAILVAFNFFFLFYATSLMSEAPYFLLSLLTVFVAEKYLQKPSRKWLVVTVALSALAFHVRTIGLVLVGAVWLFLILQKRWKESALYLLGALTCTVLPWGLWVKGHLPAPDAFNYPLVYVYGGYAPEYAINAPHEPIIFMQAVVEKGILPLFDAALLLMFPLLTNQFGSVPMLLTFLGFIGAALLLAKGLFHLRIRQFSVSGLYVTFYLMVTAGWLYPGQAARFLLMILPWLWLYFFQFMQNGCANTSRFKMRMKQALLIVFVAFVTIWPSVQGYQLLHRMRANHWLEPSGQAASLWPDYQAAFEFIRAKTNLNDRVAGIWDPAVYLYTQRPSFGLFTSALQPVKGQITAESVNRLFNSLRHYGVDYVLDEPFLLNQELKAPHNPVVEVLKSQYPKAFQPVYQSPNQWITVYKLTDKPLAPTRGSLRE